MTVSIPNPSPEWIYEGYDSSKFEDATGIVTNRAPKQIQANVNEIVRYLNEDLDPRVQSIEKLRQVYMDSPIYNNQNTYNKWDVVNDGNGVLYISKVDGNYNHPLSDRDWWVPVNIFINDDIVDEYHTWSSAKLEEFLINHAYDASRIPIVGGNAEETMNEIRFRVDTKENWELHNPVLERGEPGVEMLADGTVDTQCFFKIGDGVSTWTELEWVNDRQWVIEYLSGTGSTSGGGSTSGQNNLVHTVGNETIDGVKTFLKDIVGTVQKARYADLAEYYHSDFVLNPGEVVKFGGQYEITKSSPAVAVNPDKVDDWGDACAVVSSDPGLIMNNAKGGETGWYHIALTGRVPVLCVGPIEKFDYIVNSVIPGRAMGMKKHQLKPGQPILGRALQAKESTGEELVLCSVNITMG